uniref:hypothetical protein n=1 Tax=Streptomyces venezuelae TaxID=54571 RepID=UPI00278BE9B4
MNAPVVVRPVTAAETAVGGVAHRRLHLPTSVEFTGDEERPDYGARLEALLLGAVARAIEKDDRDAGIARPPPRGAPGPPPARPRAPPPPPPCRGPRPPQAQGRAPIG